DYGFHGVIQHVNEEVLADMQLLRDSEGIASFKIYLTYDDMLPDGDVFKVLERAQELGLVVCAHCENDGVVNTLRKRFVDEGKTTPFYHPLSRPAECEEEAIFRFLTIAELAKEAKVYVVHLTTQLGLDAIRYKRAAGQKNIFAETCPQYLTLDDHLYTNENEALKYLMSPPLRKQDDIQALWDGLAKNDIDTIGTDHCPFFFATQKQRGANNFTMAPNGAPGIELRMPLIFSEGFVKGRLSLPQVVRQCSTRPAEIFGFAHQKGDIAPGLDADLVLFDPTVEWTVHKENLHENVDYTPYEGIKITGAPVATISRGEVIVENGILNAEKGRGKYIFRKTNG
ncbi:MAG: dihydropyrimidinase, partial [Oscillospiraceae bacterium]